MQRAASRDPRRTAALASVGVASTLAALKLATVLLTGSVAVLATLVDSLADVAASTITLVSVRYALRPPDRTHRFGHGKAEALSALAQGIFLAGAGAVVVIDALRRLFDPVPLQNTWPGIAVMTVALVLTLALILYQRRVVRLTDSTAIAADRAHFEGDLVSGGAVLLALVLLSQTDATWVDPLVGIAVAVYLVASAARVGRTALRDLMDEELPQTWRDRVEAVVLAHPDAQAMHDLRTRRAGGRKFVEFHLELDGRMSLDDAHLVTDEVEQRLRRAFPDAEVVIHQEPAGIEDPRLDHRVAKTAVPAGGGDPPGGG
jgi:ferrous-iron efflux pump FieF